MTQKYTSKNVQQKLRQSASSLKINSGSKKEDTSRSRRSVHYGDSKLILDQSAIRDVPMSKRMVESDDSILDHKEK